jgi:hypothetical protein
VHMLATSTCPHLAKPCIGIFVIVVPQSFYVKRLLYYQNRVAQFRRTTTVGSTFMNNAVSLQALALSHVLAVLSFKRHRIGSSALEGSSRQPSTQNLPNKPF